MSCFWHSYDAYDCLRHSDVYLFLIFYAKYWGLQRHTESRRYNHADTIIHWLLRCVESCLHRQGSIHVTWKHRKVIILTDIYTRYKAQHCHLFVDRFVLRWHTWLVVVLILTAATYMGITHYGIVEVYNAFLCRSDSNSSTSEAASASVRVCAELRVLGEALRVVSLTTTV